MNKDIKRIFDLGGQSYQLVNKIGLINDEFSQAEVETNPADVLAKVIEWYVSECYEEATRETLQTVMSDMIQATLDKFYAVERKYDDRYLTLVRMVECEGQSTCHRCHKHGKWNRQWTNMMYRITSPDGNDEYPGHYCADCANKLRKLTYKEFDKMREESKI